MDAAPPERALLADALGIDDPDSVTLVSREPLGAGSVAGFHVPGDADTALTYFVDTSRRVVRAETGFLSGSPEHPQARIWLHPADPHLPALAPVAFSEAVQSLLRRLGVDATGIPELVVYRPGRRAVLSVPTTEGTAWLKAVPPDRVQTIVDAHRAFADVGVPVPAVRGWSDHGLMVWDAAPGTPAPDAPWTATGLLDEVDELRRRFAGVVLARPARTHLDRRLDWYAERLLDVLPLDDAAVVAAVAGKARASWDDPTSVTVHGDLHFGQLFLDDRLRVVGVIDVDTAGEGAPSDDTGAFLAHAVASAVLTPEPRDERVWELARLALARWDGPALRARAATHLLGHALGAWEVGARERARRLTALAASVSIGDVAALVPPRT